MCFAGDDLQDGRCVTVAGHPDTELLPADDAGLDRAAALLREGRLVAFPTETVYGLGADATNGQAVASVFEAKGRPRFNPLIVHVPSLAEARRCAEIDGDALRLAEAFWPGPLTLVVPVVAASGISDLVTAGLETIALRVPEAPMARDLIARAGRPIAAPSANPSGSVSPTTADHVMSGLSGRIDAVLDGGPCDVGLESTIVAVGDAPTLLRPGGLPVEQIEAGLGRSVLARDETGAVTAPGQLESHYAPSVGVRLDAKCAGAGEVMLGFGDVDGDMNLSPSGDMREAAANLFAALRALDNADGRTIAVAPIPDTGLGRAINDRLRRAGAPRPT